MSVEQAHAGPTQTADQRSIWVIFSGLMLALLIASLDQTVVATALPTIVSDLGGLSQLSWVVTGYLLASTVSTPLWGKLGDLYGRKRLFQAAIVLFLLGSALCGLSQNLAELILFRGLRSEEHTSELQSHSDLVCRLLLEKKNTKKHNKSNQTS